MVWGASVDATKKGLRLNFSVEKPAGECEASMRGFGAPAARVRESMEGRAFRVQHNMKAKNDMPEPL